MDPSQSNPISLKSGQTKMVRFIFIPRSLKNEDHECDIRFTSTDAGTIIRESPTIDDRTFPVP